MSTPKYIICDCAVQDWGKTETLRKVISDLKEQGDYSLIGEEIIDDDKKADYKNDDLYCRLQSGSVRIIILTYGDREDDNEIEDDYLEKIESELPDIIVCASSWRTGKVYSKIEEIADEYEYNLIAFSNLNSENNRLLNDILYQKSADCVEKLIDKYVWEIKREKLRNGRIRR